MTRQIATLLYAGSNPALVSIIALEAQLEERSPTKAEVESSSLSKGSKHN